MEVYLTLVSLSNQIISFNNIKTKKFRSNKTRQQMHKSFHKTRLNYCRIFRRTWCQITQLLKKTCNLRIMTMPTSSISKNISWPKSKSNKASSDLWLKICGINTFCSSVQDSLKKKPSSNWLRVMSMTCYWSTSA